MNDSSRTIYESMSERELRQELSRYRTGRDVHVVMLPWGTRESYARAIEHELEKRKPKCPTCGKALIQNAEGDLETPGLARYFWECPNLCEMETTVKEATP